MKKGVDPRSSLARSSAYGDINASASIITQRELSYLEEEDHELRSNPHEQTAQFGKLPPLKGALSKRRESFNIMDEIEVQEGSELDDSSSSGFLSEDEDDEDDSLFIVRCAVICRNQSKLPSTATRWTALWSTI